jgi:hypothetical protein
VRPALKETFCAAVHHDSSGSCDQGCILVARPVWPGWLHCQLETSLNAIAYMPITSIIPEIWRASRYASNLIFLLSCLCTALGRARGPMASPHFVPRRDAEATDIHYKGISPSSCRKSRLLEAFEIKVPTQSRATNADRSLGVPNEKMNA